MNMTIRKFTSKEFDTYVPEKTKEQIDGEIKKECTKLVASLEADDDNHYKSLGVLIIELNSIGDDGEKTPMYMLIKYSVKYNHTIGFNGRTILKCLLSEEKLPNEFLDVYNEIKNN